MPLYVSYCPCWYQNSPCSICSEFGSDTFSTNFALRSHTSAVCSSCLYHIWYLQRIRQYLDLSRAKLLANALVSRCLNYCNSTLLGIADTDLNKFQCGQNRLVCVVTKSSPFSSNISLLSSLHWLPVKLKMCSTSVCRPTKLHGKQPVVFSQCLSHHSHPIQWYQRKQSLCWSLMSIPMQLQRHFTLAPLFSGRASRCLPICGAGIAERVSALDWLSLRYSAIITLPVSNPSLCS